jgi:cytosine/adenosine deaminase-related metal-dependent hydrolase
MLTYISADWVFPIASKPIKNGVIGLSAHGEIHSICTYQEATTKGILEITHYDGVLVPGFINTHCHLELSHLRGKIEEKTGLTDFIKGILSQRAQPEDEIITAMQMADQEMYDNGIVAVGDISNVITSKTVKLSSKIYYHTFVEVFGFNSPAQATIAAGVQLKEDFKPLKASLVPHAPYSVSSALFTAIKEHTAADDILSIHNQETKGENELFESGTGKFAVFFGELGIAQSEAHATQRRAINYHLPQLHKEVNTLLVHNTMSNKSDLDFAKNEHQKLYWCLCPNANLYIENTLPDVDLFKNENLNLTLGTDSLASNHQLNILAEMQILQEHKNVSFEESLKWATLNGAEFLGIDAQYGSLSVGKRPGINLIRLGRDQKIEDLHVKKII